MRTLSDRLIIEQASSMKSWMLTSAVDTILLWASGQFSMCHDHLVKLKEG